MSVFLLVLKIIGITLLSIIGLILVLLLLILFVPVRYRVRADVHESVSGSAKATWLLHILSFSLIYEGKELSDALKVFGIPIRRREKKERTEKQKKKETKQTADPRKPEEQDDGKILDRLPREDEYRLEGFDRETSREAHTEETKEPGRVQKIIDKIKSTYEKIRDFVNSIQNKTELLCDEKNRVVIKRSLGRVLKLLGAIRPRKLKGEFHFGFEEPDTTGKILAVAAILYAWIGPSFVLKPDFEEVVLEGDADLKGRIFLITVAVIGARLYFDKELRRFYAKLKEA